MAVSSNATGPALAAAKINLFLHVVGRRDDGLHLLESLVAFASIGDRLTVHPAEGGLTLQVTGPFASRIDGTAEDNLVLRAARALQEHANSPAGARLVLEKNLPVAAGIGGGSADAAAALRSLRDFWSVDMTDAELAELGLGLGADIPVCVTGKPVTMRGIGEQLTEATIPDALGIVLVNPRKPLPTPAVFADFRSFGQFAPMQSHDWSKEASQADWLIRLQDTRNSLQEPAQKLLPVISTMIETLQAQNGCLLARMSGSGATCFGLFTDWQIAARRADRMAQQHPDWWIAPGHLLS